MATKSLKEVYGYKKKAKKLTSRGLRSVILSEMNSILLEQDEEAEGEGAEKTAGGKIGDAPKGDAVSKTTNVKDVDPVEIVNQLLSGKDDSPIVQSASGKWFAYDGAAGKAWVEKVGPEVVVDRIKALAAKIPSSGLPKSEMPFLPGPPDAKGDVKDVEDALTPGGKYNIDTHDGGESKGKKKKKEDAVKEAVVRGMQYLMEKTPPPAPNTFVGMKGGGEEFMTGGLAANDGDEDDDQIDIVVGGEIPAADAIPTQANILIYKALGMAVDGMAGGDLDAWAGIGGEILDGHHRWAATMLNDPSASLGTAGQVDLNALGKPKEMLKYLTAIGNAVGNETKTEARYRSEDTVIMERWNKLAGLLNG